MKVYTNTPTESVLILQRSTGDDGSVRKKQRTGNVCYWTKTSK